MDEYQSKFTPSQEFVFLIVECKKVTYEQID